MAFSALTVIDDAVQVLRQLPEDAQRAVARAILEYSLDREREF